MWYSSSVPRSVSLVRLCCMTIRGLGHTRVLLYYLAGDRSSRFSGSVTGMSDGMAVCHVSSRYNLFLELSLCDRNSATFNIHQSFDPDVQFPYCFLFPALP